MSAIPSACQPSKNSGSTSTQRRYFSTALSSSPMARSPLASSKISSRVSTRPKKRASALGPQETGFALAFAEPIVKNKVAFVVQNTLLEGSLVRLILSFVGRFAFLKHNDESAVFRWNKFAHLARLKLRDRVFDCEQIRRLVLFRGRRFFGLDFVHEREWLDFLCLYIHFLTGSGERLTRFQGFAQIVRGFRSLVRRHFPGTIAFDRFDNLGLCFFESKRSRFGQGGEMQNVKAVLSLNRLAVWVRRRQLKRGRRKLRVS